MVIIAGADKGKRGKIIAVNGKQQRVIVEGAHMIKRHMRKSEREGTIHISNVMNAEEFDARAARHGAAAPAQA